MRVLLVSSTALSPNLADFHHRAFVSAGCEVKRLQLKFVKKLSYFPNKLFKLSGLSPGFQYSLSEKMPSGSFDLILVYQSFGMTADVQEVLRDRTSCLINYWSDNPSVGDIIDMRGFSRFLKFFDHVAVPTSVYAPIFYAKGAQSVQTLEFGFSSELHHYDPVLTNATPKRIAYFGAKNEEVASLIEHSPIPVDIFGNHWSTLKVRNARICVGGVGSKFPDVVKKYPVVINQTRPRHFSGVSMKLFELAAMGRVVIMNREPIRTPDFVHGRHAVLFDNGHQFKQSIEDVCNGQFDLIGISSNARQLVERFEYTANIKRFLSRLNF